MRLPTSDSEKRSPVGAESIGIVEELDRDDADSHEALVRSVEPLYQALSTAVHEGIFASEPAYEEQLTRDLESLGRELWQTEPIRTRLIFEYAAFAARALTKLETDPVSRAFAESVLPPEVGSPRDAEQAAQIRTRVANEIPATMLPSG